MSVPQPEHQIEGHCSAIHAGVLYVYQAAGLQSLPLKENATWSVAPTGQPVNGAACVIAVPNGDASQAALYVIGGSADDSSFRGLQRYFFRNKTWETLLPLEGVDVLQSRTNHSAVYLNDSRSILVYAGSQPAAPSLLSSQTFLIHTHPPYDIRAFTSQAPPTNQPILQPWNNTHAVMVGGSPWSTQVNLFDPSSGWQQLGTNVSEPLPIGTRGTIVSGSDGSKVLETYDTISSPNKVTQTVLLGANGERVPNGQTIGSSNSSRKRKRHLTLANWPSYNSTNAPSVTRSDYSVAQDQNGLAVIAGGNDQTSVSMFDQTRNTWVDARRYFNGDSQQPLQPSAASGFEPAATSSTSLVAPSESASAAASPGGETAHDRMLRTLGITLGVLCGIAAAFILVLLLMRWRKMRRGKKEGYVNEKTGTRMSFADRGASFMKEAGGSINNLAPPAKDRYGPNGSYNGSHSSIAIIAGKLNGNKYNTNSQAARGSFESTTHLVKNRDGHPVTSEPVEMMDIGDKSAMSSVARKPAPRSEQLAPPTLVVYGSSPEKDVELRNRSSGWSKYFATSQPDGLSHLPSAYLKQHTSSDGSEYTDGRGTSQLSRIPSSALVPPLDIDFLRTIDGQRMSHVTSGSPAFSNSTDDLAKRGNTTQAAEGQRGIIDGADRPYSSTNTVSSCDRSTMSSNLTSDYYNQSGNTPWTPVSNAFRDTAQKNTAHSRSSSVYTNSVYEPRVPSRGARGASTPFFPGAGTTFKPPPKAKLGHKANPSAEWAAAKASLATPAETRDSTVTVFPGAPGADSQAAEHRQGNNPPVPKAAPASKPASEDRVSTMTLFPGGVPSAHSQAAERRQEKNQLAPNAAPVSKPAPEDRVSTLTLFPRGVNSAYYAHSPAKGTKAAAQERTPANTDMSWLNLGLGSNKI